MSIFAKIKLKSILKTNAHTEEKNFTSVKEQNQRTITTEVSEYQNQKKYLQISNGRIVEECLITSMHGKKQRF